MESKVTPFWCSIAFWLAFGVWAFSIAGHYGRIFNGYQGIVTANLASMAYCLFRTIEKRRAKSAWKGILFGSEHMGSLVTATINILEPSFRHQAMRSESSIAWALLLLVLSLLFHTLGGQVQVARAEAAPSPELRRMLGLATLAGDSNGNGNGNGIPKAIDPEAVTKKT